MTRSLGTLTLDLIARIGGFTKGLTQAERAAEKSQREMAERTKRRAAELKGVWVSLSRTITNALPTITAIAVLDKFIQKSQDVQNEQAQLASVLKSTGNAAGFTQEQLNAMAVSMERVLPDTGDVNNAQTALLQYTNVVGDEFVRALTLAGDLAARTGQSMVASATRIGKALNAPAEGVLTLKELGIVFTAEQLKVIKALTETGKQADAQRVILDALTKSFGGAAKAARGTLAGSLNALYKAYEALLTLDANGVEGLREATESLVDLLNSKEFKSGVATLLTAFVKIIEVTGKAVGSIVNVTRTLSESVARFAHGSADSIERLDDRIALLRSGVDQLQRAITGRPQALPWVAKAKEDVAKLNAEIEELIKQREDIARQRLNAPAQRAVPAPADPTVDLQALSVRQKASDEAKSAAKEAARAADAYIQRLKDQIEATKDLTQAQTVLRDIQEGKLKGPRKDEAIKLAEELDLIEAQHEANEQIVKDFEAQGEAFERAAEKIRQGRSFAQDVLLSQDPIAQLQAQLEERKELLADYAEQDAENQALFAQAAVALEQQTQDQITRLNEDAEKRRADLRKAEQDRYLKAASGFFSDLESLQDVSSDRIAKVAKAAAIANAIVKTYESANSAYASLAGIPVVGPALGATAAAAAIAAGLANVQAIRATSNRAGGGPVSADSPYMVGEVGPELFVPQSSGFVVPNQLLDRVGGGSQVNQRIINVIDPGMVGDFMATPSGEQVLLNVIRRNADSVKAVVSNG